MKKVRDRISDILYLTLPDEFLYFCYFQDGIPNLTYSNFFK